VVETYRWRHGIIFACTNSCTAPGNAPSFGLTIRGHQLPPFPLLRFSLGGQLSIGVYTIPMASIFDRRLQSVNADSRRSYSVYRDVRRHVSVGHSPGWFSRNVGWTDRPVEGRRFDCRDVLSTSGLAIRAVAAQRSYDVLTEQ